MQIGKKKKISIRVTGHWMMLMNIQMNRSGTSKLQWNVEFLLSKFDSKIHPSIHQHLVVSTNLSLL